MLYQAGDKVPFGFVFTDSSGDGKTPSPVPTVDIDRLDIAAGTLTQVVTGGALTAGNLTGEYLYVYTSPGTGNYAFIARARTTDTSVQAKTVWSWGETGRTWVGRVDEAVSAAKTLTSAYDAAKTAASSADYTAARAAKLDNLDAAVTSRLAGATYSAPPTTAAIVTAMDATSADLDTLIGNLGTLLARLTVTRAGNLDNLTTTPLTATQTANAVLDGAAANHNLPNTVGAKINLAGSAADPLLNDPATYPQGTAGAALNALTRGVIQVVAPVSEDGLTIGPLVAGDDYAAVDGAALEWTFPTSFKPVSVSGATVTFRVQHPDGVLSKTGALVSATTPIVVRVELASADTVTIPPGDYPFSLRVILSGSERRRTFVREGILKLRGAI